MGAIISDCGKYRYALWREGELDQPTKDSVLFIMLNPSTADADLDDPTIRRCKGFAKAWGCNGVIVGNLYSYRATNPQDMKKAEDPVGEMTNHYLTRMLKRAGENSLVICAWGNNADKARQEEVKQMAKDLGVNLYHLGLTKQGFPKHPLYIKSDQEPILWDSGN